MTPTPQNLPARWQQAQLKKASGIIPFYLTPAEVSRMAAAAAGRHQLRDKLLILTLFWTALRVSEAVSLTPAMISYYQGQPFFTVQGKGKKNRLVSCPEPLIHQLQSFAYSQGLKRDDRFFKITRVRAWQIIKELGERAGIAKEVWPHLFRHSGAIERLRQTRNPKSLQIHLGHSSMSMSMRYLTTLSAQDALEIESQVQYREE